MKVRTIALALALVVALALPAMAEVEEITVGGDIQIRGQALEPGFGSGVIRGFLDRNGNGLVDAGDLPISQITQPVTAFCDDDDGLEWYTLRARVNVDAKLSGGVRGYVELQAYDFWGIDFDDSGGVIGGEAGTDPINSGGDYGVADAGNDVVELYQAFIQMNDIADYPLQLTIGRQELVYGREFLIGNNDAGIDYSGLAFDAIKLSYAADEFMLDAWTAKLADLGTPITVTGEEDGDTDFYGLYGTYTGFENMTLDLYGLLVRTGANTRLQDVDTLYTVGARLAGVFDIGAGMIDYNLEGALQFGDTAADGDYEGFALNAMAGYTFDDIDWTPRIEAEWAYFSGDDNSDEDVETFARLFSDVHYGELNFGGDLDNLATNMHILRIGGSAVPTEKLTVSADFYLFLLDEEDGAVFGLAQYEQTATSPVSLVAAADDDSIGYELDLAADYQYTEDLNLRLGWAHLFVDDALENSWGAGDDDDIDYLYVQAALAF